MNTFMLLLGDYFPVVFGLAIGAAVATVNVIRTPTPTTLEIVMAVLSSKPK